MVHLQILSFVILASVWNFIGAAEEDETESGDLMHFWPLQFKKGFACPAIYGRYPHEKDCSMFYECRHAYPHLMKCSRGKLYDAKGKQCNDRRRVKCGKYEKDNKDHDHDQDHKELEKDEQSKTFRCPYIWGTFAHPFDCSKYFVCVYNVPALFQCYGSNLYDERSRRCQDERRVTCGKRQDRDHLRTTRRPNVRTTSLRPRDRTTTETQTTEEDMNRFRCPFPYGRYADPLNCSQFYECHSTIPTIHKCPESTLYDERKEECLAYKYVRCGERPNGKDDEENQKDKKKEIRCPYLWGIFPHPDDCTKYMICIYNVPTVFNCGKYDLFHAYYRKCFPKDQVECDYGINPDDLSPQTPKTNPTTTMSPTSTRKASTPPTSTTIRPTTNPIPTRLPTTRVTTPTPTNRVTTPTLTPTTTPIPITYTTTSRPVTSTITLTVRQTSSAFTSTRVGSTTKVSMTPQSTTNAPKPNTPPPTDCEEDDLDCIIDGTGDVGGWFDCPERYGHFPHGSSHQLFIHCDNWHPYIKKCADDTVFSPKYLVCMWLDKPGVKTSN